MHVRSRFRPHSSPGRRRNGKISGLRSGCSRTSWRGAYTTIQIKSSGNMAGRHTQKKKFSKRFLTGRQLGENLSSNSFRKSVLCQKHSSGPENALEAIRTPNLQLRKLALCPIELREHKGQMPELDRPTGLHRPVCVHHIEMAIIKGNFVVYYQGNDGLYGSWRTPKHIFLILL